MNKEPSKTRKTIKKILASPQQASVEALGGAILSERRYGGPLGELIYEIVKAGGRIDKNKEVENERKR